MPHKFGDPERQRCAKENMMTISKRYGIAGAVTAPLVLGALVFIRCMLPCDSFMYSALQKIFWIPTIPLFWLMQKVMEGCGIGVHGEDMMDYRYFLPLFAAMLTYWAALGFVVGCLIAKFRSR